MPDAVAEDPLYELGWRHITAAPAAILGQPLTLLHMFGATERMDAGWTKAEMLVAFRAGWTRYKLDEQAR